MMWYERAATIIEIAGIAVLIFLIGMEYGIDRERKPKKREADGKG